MKSLALVIALSSLASAAQGPGIYTNHPHAKAPRNPIMAPKVDSPTGLNVIVIDVCSARADRMGAYGHDRDTTPKIDKIAKNNILFETAMAQSSWCLPNFASLLTGYTPEVHGQYLALPFSKPPAFAPTLAERMKMAGYKTAAFSGGIFTLQGWGLERGFDTYNALYSTSHHISAQFSSYRDEALNWLSKNQKEGKQSFMYITVDDLHTPYQSEDPNLFDPGYEGIANDTMTVHVRTFRIFNGEPYDPKLPAAMNDKIRRDISALRNDPLHMRHIAARYDAALKEVDNQLGYFTQKLKDMGLWDEAMVIITADHGEMLGEKDLLGHSESLYEGNLHVPLIVHHPRMKHRAGTRVKKLVQRIDLTPTIYEAAGVDYSNLELQGKSIMPLMKDSNAPHPKYGYASSKRALAGGSKDLMIDERVIRDQRWKLHWYMYKNRYELYDLKNDPHEKKDVASKHPDIVMRLSLELLNHVERIRPHGSGLPSGRPGVRYVPLLPKARDKY
jgi:arylsulfatase A-like enzyme